MAPGVAKGYRGGPSELVKTVGQDYNILFGTCCVSAAGILFP